MATTSSAASVCIMDSRAQEEETMYLSHLLYTQTQRLNRVRELIVDRRQLLEMLRAEVLREELSNTMGMMTGTRHSSEGSHVTRDVGNLREINRLLLVDIQVYSNQLDLYRNGQEPPGHVDPLGQQSFYDNMPTGPDSLFGTTELSTTRSRGNDNRPHNKNHSHQQETQTPQHTLQHEQQITRPQHQQQEPWQQQQQQQTWQQPQQQQTWQQQQQQQTWQQLAQLRIHDPPSTPDGRLELPASASEQQTRRHSAPEAQQRSPVQETSPPEARPHHLQPLSPSTPPGYWHMGNVVEVLSPGFDQASNYAGSPYNGFDATSREPSNDVCLQDMVMAQWSCPCCTFLNHPELRECEVCGASK